MISPDGLISISDAAKYFGLPRTTVASWADPRPGRGYIDAQGNPQRLTPVDHRGPRKAARYRFKQVMEAEFCTSANRSRSHRRTPDAKKIQDWRVNLLAPA
jgi:hypothetical protein